MTRHVADALAQHYDQFVVGESLHEVPPHETYAVTVGGQPAVCKRATEATGDPATEAHVMRFVARETDLPVPEVLAVGDDHFVAAWCPAAPAPDEQSLDEAWGRAAGRCLGTLHAQTAGTFDAYGKPRAEGDALVAADGPDWTGAVRASLRRRRATISEFGYADVADAVLDYLDDHPDAFAGAGDPVLCHGWATPDHVAVADGEVTCLLDFEHALVAPGEWDYWRTALPAFDGPDGDDGGADAVERAFRAGYEDVRPLPDGFERRQPLYAVLNTVYYVESLFVQRNVPAEEREERAAWMREFVIETLADRRERAE